jgi:hypothetical protein
MRIISFAEADDLLGGALTDTFQGQYRTVLYVDGALELTGEFLPALTARCDPAGADIIAVAGDLTVTGPIELYEHRPALYVGGFTRAETLEGGDCEICIGNGAITHLVYGYYNDGILDAGRVEVPWVINSDHDLRITAPDAAWIDNFNGDSFGQFSFQDAFVPEVLDHDEGERTRIDVAGFLSRLRAGLPVLR